MFDKWTPCVYPYWCNYCIEIQQGAKFSVATPFAIRYASDVAQMGMSLTGDTAGTAKFSAELTWAAS